MGKAPQRPRDPKTCRRGLNAETIGEFLIGQLIDHPQLERFTLPRRECLELTFQRQAGREALLDLGEPIFGGEVERQAESLACARLDLIAPDSVRKNVASNPEQPRQRQTVVIVAEPTDAQKSSRERLSGEIAGRPGKPSRQPRIHLANVPAVQL